MEDLFQDEKKSIAIWQWALIIFFSVLLANAATLIAFEKYLIWKYKIPTEAKFNNLEKSLNDSVSKLKYSIEKNSFKNCSILKQCTKAINTPVRFDNSKLNKHAINKQTYISNQSISDRINNSEFMRKTQEAKLYQQRKIQNRTRVVGSLKNESITAEKLKKKKGPNSCEFWEQQYRLKASTYNLNKRNEACSEFSSF